MIFAARMVGRQNSRDVLVWVISDRSLKTNGYFIDFRMRYNANIHFSQIMGSG
jgi:hypothetical protein